MAGSGCVATPNAALSPSGIHYSTHNLFITNIAQFALHHAVILGNTYLAEPVRAAGPAVRHVYGHAHGLGHLPDILQHLVRQRIHAPAAIDQSLEDLLHPGAERGIVQLERLDRELGREQARPEHGIVGQELVGTTVLGFH